MFRIVQESCGDSVGRAAETAGCLGDCKNLLMRWMGILGKIKPSNAILDFLFLPLKLSALDFMLNAALN